jgi:flagellar biosynthesis/type III secretory pathway protein FliH
MADPRDSSGDDIEIVIKGKPSRPDEGNGGIMPPRQRIQPASASPPAAVTRVQATPVGPPPAQPSVTSAQGNENSAIKTLLIALLVAVVSLGIGFFAGKGTRESSTQVSDRIEAIQKQDSQHEASALKAQKSDLSGRFQNTLEQRTQESYQRGVGDGQQEGYQRGYQTAKEEDRRQACALYPAAC